MGYLIEAHFDNGRPALWIADAATRQVKLQWHYDPASDSAQVALKQLFRALALLSCQNKLSPPPLGQMAALAAACVTCDRCESDVSRPNISPL